MKNLLLPLMVLLSTTCICFAQFGTCEPDQTYADSSLGVYPLPFNPDSNALGGITDSACLNKKYQFTFTAALGDTFKIGTTSYPLDSIRIGGISNMPDGFGFNTNNPPTNTFYKNELGCVVIYGTATNDTDLGEHELLISATLYTNGLPIPLEFPNPIIYNGHYYLYVLEENDTNCLVVNVDFQYASQFGYVQNLPNPFSTITVIEVESWKSGDYHFQVSDMFGRVVHQRSVRIEEGKNRIAFDGISLAPGLYLYTFSNGQAMVSKKMLISRE